MRTIQTCGLSSLEWHSLPFLTYVSHSIRTLPSVRQYSPLYSCLSSSLVQGSEASGYVIALLGVCIWYTAAPWKRGKWAIALMVFVFILSGMGNCDLIPKTIRHDYIQTYALRALPISIVWLWLCYELCTKDYTPIEKVNAHE